jgi:hypothetical protein
MALQFITMIELLTSTAIHFRNKNNSNNAILDVNITCSSHFSGAAIVGLYRGSYYRARGPIPAWSVVSACQCVHNVILAVQTRCTCVRASSQQRKKVHIALSIRDLQYSTVQYSTPQHSTVEHNIFIGIKCSISWS